MSSRVFIGRLSSRATERDVERFFDGYGRIRDIVLKNGFGFVEFEDARDADDAIYDLNGKDLAGERVTVELSRRGPQSGGRGGGYGGGRDSYDRRPPRPRMEHGRGPVNSRYGPPTMTRYRIIVENLSTRVSWQDLKDILRKAGCEPTYADAHRQKPNEAVVCFSSRSDVDRAIDKLDGEDFNGRKIKIVDDCEQRGSRSRSRSRSRSPRRRSRSASRSRSPRRSRSRDSRSRSRSAHSRSVSPMENGKKSRSPSAEKDRSASPKRDSKSRSASPIDD